MSLKMREALQRITSLNSLESFWGRLKEQIGPTADMSHEEIASLVDDYIDYYNNERGQERLGWLTPTEYAAKLVA